MTLLAILTTFCFIISIVVCKAEPNKSLSESKIQKAKFDLRFPRCANGLDCRKNDDCCSKSCIFSGEFSSCNCSANGKACSQNSDCCGKSVCPFKFIGNSFCKNCGKPGERCLTDRECCSGNLCLSESHAGGITESRCRPCISNRFFCLANDTKHPCCLRQCSRITKFSPRINACCGKNGASCTFDVECCSNICIPNLGGSACSQCARIGAVCGKDQHCCGKAFCLQKGDDFVSSCQNCGTTGTFCEHNAHCCSSKCSSTSNKCIK